MGTPQTKLKIDYPEQTGILLEFLLHILSFHKISFANRQEILDHICRYNYIIFLKITIFWKIINLTYILFNSLYKYHLKKSIFAEQTKTLNVQGLSIFIIQHLLFNKIVILIIIISKSIFYMQKGGYKLQKNI